MAGAVAELEALLADLVRVLGADHPGTLAARGNLAGWRGEAGDVAELEALLADLAYREGCCHRTPSGTAVSVVGCCGYEQDTLESRRGDRLGLTPV